MNNLFPHPDFILPTSYTRAIQAWELNKPTVKQFEVDERFSQENLVKLPKLSWLSQISMTLVSPDDYPIDSFLDLVSTLITEFDPLEKSRGLLACDLETTSLFNRAHFVNSARISDVGIVGVGIAVSDTQGFYLPVNHNGLDGVPNWSIDDIKYLFSQLQDSYSLVWHNGSYDLTVLTSNGIKINKQFNYCSQIATVALQLWEYDYSWKSSGLKFLSEEFLKRPMVEINELFSLPKNSVITFDALPAKNALVYGVSDVVNTMGIWKWAIYEHPNSLLKQGTFIFKLEMNTVYNTTALLDSGFPADFDYTKQGLLDLLMNIIQIEDNLSLFDKSVNFLSADQAGVWLANFIITRLSEHMSEANVLRLLRDKFGVAPSTQKLKTGGEKVRWSSNSDILESYKANVSVLRSYISERDISLFLSVIDNLLQYRELQHNVGLFVSFARNIRYDDRGHYVPFTLRHNGTDTGRYSNGKTSLPRVQTKITPKQNKLSQKYTESHCLLNAQGLPAYSSVDTAELTEVEAPAEVLAKYNKLLDRAKARMSELLLVK